MQWINELTTQGAVTLWIFIGAASWVAVTFIKAVTGAYLPRIGEDETQKD